MDTEPSDRNRRIDQERLDRCKSGHPDELAGQITPPAEPDKAFPAIDWQFLDDFLCRVTAPEPERRNIGEEIVKLDIARRPGNERPDDNRLRQEDYQILAVGRENSELALQQDRQ